MRKRHLVVLAQGGSPSLHLTNGGLTVAREGAAVFTRRETAEWAAAAIRRNAVAFGLSGYVVTVEEVR